MVNYMFILRPTEKVVKTVCPTCAKRGEVVNTCMTCHGSAVQKKHIPQYYVQDRPIPITYIDRDCDTGILRYWENSSEFYYETTCSKLNKYVPEVPYGVHLCHDTWKSAKAECERINNYLHEKNKVLFTGHQAGSLNSKEV